MLSSEASRKQIAVVVPGGIGTGPNNMGVPVMEKIVQMIAGEFNVTVFSLFKVNADYHPAGFDLVEVGGRNAISKTIAFLRVFRDHHHRKSFAVIHAFWTLPSGFMSVLAAKLFGIRSVISVLGGDAVALPNISYGELRKPVHRRVILWSLNAADEVIVLTRYLEDNLRRHGLVRRVRVIPWGIDVGSFAFSDKPIGVPVRFLYVANLTPVKDPLTALRTFREVGARIPSALTMIGTGPLRERLEAMVKEWGLSSAVSFVDSVPYKLLPPYYHRSDILLHTSLSEGQSEVVTEAMSSGVIVCGTRTGLMYDQPDCCITVETGNYKELADKIQALIQDRTARSGIRDRARRWAVDHRIEWTVREIQKCYEP